MVRVRAMLGCHHRQTTFEKKEWRMTKAEDGKRYVSLNKRIEEITINLWVSMMRILDMMMILGINRSNDVIVKHHSL